MAANELDIYLTGGSTNTDPNQSLGGESSNTTVTYDSPTLFDDIQSSEIANSDYTDYRVIDLCNVGGRTLYNARFWIAWGWNVIYDGLAFDWGSDLAAHPGSDRLDMLSSEQQDPLEVNSSITWFEFVNYDGTITHPITFPTMEAGKYVRIWLRRTFTQGTVLEGTYLNYFYWSHEN